MRRILVPLMAAFLVAPAAQSDTVTINVANTAFGVGNAAVTINAGDTVEWVWVSGTHTVTSGPNGTADGKFNGSLSLTSTSFKLSPDMANYPFNQSGTYPYFCTFHFACCNMASSIVVRAVATNPNRTLSGTVKAAVAVARNGTSAILAAVAGTKLYLMNALDGALADLGGWSGGLDVGSTVSGRPAFGNVGGKLAVAVGTDAGRALIIDSSNGTTIADISIPGGSIHTAPAIVNHTGGDDTYWAAQSAAGPALYQTRGTTLSAPISLGAAGATIRSSPAVFAGTLVVGTSAEVLTFRVDQSTGTLTPQAVAAMSDGFNTSPVVTRMGEALVGGDSGKAYKINLANGNPDGDVQLAAGAAPLSDPFYAASTDMAAFGGSNGEVYFVMANAIGSPPTLSSSPTFGSAAVGSPVTVGAGTYAADATGAFGRVGGTLVQMGSPAVPAVAATGSSAGTDKVIAGTTDGKLFAITVQ